MEQKLAKYLFISINLGCMFFATVLIVMGLMMLLDIYNWIPEVKKTIPTLIILVGFFIFILGFLGFCGAIIEYDSFKMIHSIITLTLISLEILLLFYTFFDHNKLVKLSEECLEQTWNAQQKGDADLTRPLIVSKEGCKDAISSYIIDNLNCFQYILLAVISMQGLVFTLGCFLAGNNILRDLSFLSALR